MNTIYKESLFFKDIPIVMNIHKGTKNVPIHAHEFLEFAYICEGEALHTCNNRVERMKKGNYVFIDYNTYHCFSEKSEDFHLINCLFVPEYIDISLKNCKSFTDVLRNYLINIYPETRDTVYVFYDDNKKVKKALDYMAEEYEKKENGYAELLRSFLLQIIIMSMRKLPTVSRYEERVEFVLEYINKNYDKRIYLKDIAEQIKCTESNISMLFKKSTGILFTDYLHHVRIKAGCAVLKDTDLSIDAVSACVGFEDTRSFRKVFKRIMGTTPLKYRINNGSNKTHELL